MSAHVSNWIAPIMFGVWLVLLIVVILCLIHGVVGFDLWRCRTCRQVRTEGKMITVQPRVNRNPDRRPPEPR